MKFYVSAVILCISAALCTAFTAGVQAQVYENSGQMTDLNNGQMTDLNNGQTADLKSRQTADLKSGQMAGLNSNQSAVSDGKSHLLAVQEPGVINVSVKGANIRLEKSKSKKAEIKYYGTASEKNYKLTEVTDGDTSKITLKRTGKGMAPTIKEGGVTIKLPDSGRPLIRIKGTDGAGIVLDGISADVKLTTENCAVVIHNSKSSNKIRIDSKHDSYEINSVPITEDFYMKSSGSVIEYTFTEQPSDIKFRLTGGYAELPEGWSRNYAVGDGKPKMTVKADMGIFELSFE